MNHPRMTSSGRQWAFVIGVLIAFMLPSHVECGFSGNRCTHIVDKQECVYYELEPLGFSLLEKVFNRNVGFAYKSGEECGADRQ